MLLRLCSIEFWIENTGDNPILEVAIIVNGNKKVEG
jgi:hypothetical protein